MGVFIKNFSSILEKINISDFDKNIIYVRYVELIKDIHARYVRFRLSYLFLTNLITVSGILIFILLSYEKITHPEVPLTLITWIIWLLSVTVTLCNKWLYVFNIPKQYATHTLMLKKLYGEGWNFVTSVGVYDSCNHTDGFKIFLTQIQRIENLSGKSLIEKYYKNDINDTDDFVDQTFIAGGPNDSKKESTLDEIV